MGLRKETTHTHTHTHTQTHTVYCAHVKERKDTFTHTKHTYME